MRRISFNLTQEQILDRAKFVTRRLGWTNAKIGEPLRGVDRLRSRAAKTLALIEVVSVGMEPLDAITPEEVEREGFPGMTPAEFVAMFLRAHPGRGLTPQSTVNRIEFRYVDEVAP